MLPGLPSWFKYDVQRKLERLAEWWRDSPVRIWASEHRGLLVAIAVGLVALLLPVVVRVARREPPPPVMKCEKEWYYDLNTGKLFTAEKDLRPPIEAPSGPLPNGEPAGVRAYVLTYVEEPNEAERFLAFLETSDPTARGASPARGRASPDNIAHWGWGRLIRRPADSRWVPADSPYGQMILQEAFSPNENGKRPHYYEPK